MTDQELVKRKARGLNAERELVKKLWKMGFAVIRGPASGSRIKKGVYPDIVVIKNRHIFVFEVKKRSKPSPIYIDKDQIEKLKEFARRAGGEALIAVKISSLRTWKVVPLTHINEHPTTAKIKIDRDIIEKAEDLVEYINKKINVGLDSFIVKT